MKIIISNEAEQALFGFKRPFADWKGGKQLPDGRWEIELQQKTYDRMVERQMDGESINDTILRICAHAAGSLQ